MPDTYLRDHMGNLTKNSTIDPSLYQRWDVKRGLRNANGSGVVVGLTRVGDVQGYDVNADGERTPVDGKLFYRGVNVEDLVKNCLKEDRFGFEETAYLLLFGVLPNKSQLQDFQRLLGRKRALPDGFIRDMILTAPSRSIMNKLARSVLALYSYDDNPDDTSLENVLRQSIDLIAYFPTLIASGYQAKCTIKGESLHLHYPDPDLGTAENILRLTRPYSEYTDLEAKLLDICMILHAEHGGGNNSSFTTHVVTSTGTDTYAAVAAAVGSLKGPKHGGANIEVIEMIQDIKKNVRDVTDRKKVREYLIRILKGEANDRSGLIYGIGHAVYTVSDPRAVLLKDMARKLAAEKGVLDEFSLYAYIEEQAPLLYREIKGSDKSMPANVDLYSGFVYQALDIPNDLATPIFAAARISGWCAHRIEELIDGGKIMRPAYKCVQPPLAYTPLADRP
jgi:citrate synthase